MSLGDSNQSLTPRVGALCTTRWIPTGKALLVEVDTQRGDGGNQHQHRSLFGASSSSVLRLSASSLYQRPDEQQLMQHRTPKR
eukprot:scaffold324_cov188-Alexandrium_tamarense.AAC.11